MTYVMHDATLIAKKDFELIQMDVEVASFLGDLNEKICTTWRLWGSWKKWTWYLSLRRTCMDLSNPPKSSTKSLMPLWSHKIIIEAIKSLVSIWRNV